jgi:predicted Zn-dependent protease
MHRTLLGAVFALLLFPSLAASQEEPGVAVDSSPDEAVQAQLKMAEIHRAKNEPQKALKILREVLAAHPDNHRVMAQVAELANDLEMTGLVIEVMPKLIDHRPKNAEYRSWLVDALLAQDRPVDAVDHLAWLFQRRPNDPEVRRGLAEAYEALKQPQDALKHYSWLITRFPKEIEYRITRSHLYGDLGRFKEQLAELRALLKMAPRNIEVRLELAEHAFHEEQFDDAEAHLNVVLKQEPKNSRALALRGRIKKAGATSRQEGPGDFNWASRYEDWLNDLQERAEDF